MRPNKINNVRFRDADRIEYVDRYIDADAGRAQTSVKKSASFMPPAAAPKTRDATTGRSTGKPKTREISTQTERRLKDPATRRTSMTRRIIGVTSVNARRARGKR